jgi:hypothetical protein
LGEEKMVEHRIFFPREKKAADDFVQHALDDRRGFEVEEFTLPQKLDFLRLLSRKAPQFRPKNGDPGKLIEPHDLPSFLSLIAELRKETPSEEFGRLLDRVYEKTKRTRDLGFPILLFR